MYPNGLPARASEDGKVTHWRHEDGSVRMLRYLIEQNDINMGAYGVQERDMLFIEEIISGTAEHLRRGRGPDKFFLYGTELCIALYGVHSA